MNEKELDVRKPMLLAYDIECTGVLGYSYGIWDTNMHKVIEQPILLSFSYAWVDPFRMMDPEYEPKIITRTLAQMDTYNVNPKEDKLLAKELYELFKKTDVTLGHNSKSFDDKMANFFFLKHRFAPVVPHLQLDTKLMAKQNCLQSDYHSEGTRANKTQRYQRYKCDNPECLGWFTALNAIKKTDGDVKPTVALQ